MNTLGSFVFELRWGQTDRITDSQTDRQTDADKRFTSATVVGISNDMR